MIEWNAKCPCCLDKWEFDVAFAELTDEQRADLDRNGNILVICEDCIDKMEAGEGVYDVSEALDYFRQEYPTRPVELPY